jgi:predicted AlkP superfamily phosphohydrolase/phosphomutase
MVENRKRVLVVGLDGATFDLIKPWAREGHLPTLARLLQQGAHGTLASTIPPMTAPAWTSFATGTNPGQHRLYDWIAREPDSYHFTPVTALDAQVPTIYTLLSEAGRRVCVLNVPMTYPAVPVNGVMISGMPAPSTKHAISYPPSAFQEVLNAVGDYILYPDPGQAYSDSGINAFLERLHRAAELRMAAFQYLLRRERWDFAMMVFNGTDTVSHALWKYMDPSHPLHDPQRAATYGSSIREYYQAVDAHLGALLASLEEDTTLVIMSDHGFGPFHKFIHVNNWLIREGFMRIQGGPRAGLKHGLFRLGFTPMNVYDRLMRLGLGALKREVVRGQGQGLLKALFLSFEDVDWSRTVAYSLGNVGQIRLNVVGREPQGCLLPGEPYYRVREEIIQRLDQLRDPATGETVVEKVYRREEIYSGDHLDQAPDIVFLPRRLEYFGFGEYEFGSHQVIESMRRGISGTHRLNGIFLAYGADIQRGAVADGAHLVDLAPTILHIMGLPVPHHVDGRVLNEVLRDGSRPVQWAEAGQSLSGSSGGNGIGFSPEDRQALAERLRALGYVG